jgi:hypothetical protein
MAVVVVAAVGVAFWFLRTNHTRLIAVPQTLTQPIKTAISRVTMRLPKTPHSIVIVIEENKTFNQIFAEADSAPYLNALAKQGALFTQSYGIAHPSQPNYFALFSGQTNTNGDQCDVTGIPADAANLGSELHDAHRTFRAYAEDLPSPGYDGCTSGQYARKHAPWTHFSNVPAKEAMPFSALTSYDALPDVAFVIPNLLHDMHSASIASGDTWLHDRIDPLIAWAKKHNSLVIVTWDESSEPVKNHIPTLFIGPMVKPGRYDEIISHYRVLRTIEDFYGLHHAGAAATAAPILDCWNPKAH